MFCIGLYNIKYNIYRFTYIQQKYYKIYIPVLDKEKILCTVLPSLVKLSKHAFKDLFNGYPKALKYPQNILVQ